MKYVRLSTDLNSCAERFENSSDMFPLRDRLLGICTRIGYHPDYKHVMIELSEDRPSFVSTNRGEYVELEEAGDKYKIYCLELAAHCEKVANELILHSERLKREANREIPMLAVDRLEKLAASLDNSYTVPDESHTPAHVKSKNHTKYSPVSTPKPVVKVDLSLFDE